MAQCHARTSRRLGRLLLSRAIDVSLLDSIMLRSKPDSHIVLSHHRSNAMRRHAGARFLCDRLLSGACETDKMVSIQQCRPPYTRVTLSIRIGAVGAMQRHTEHSAPALVCAVVVEQSTTIASSLQC
jgi:hypothetical protein